MRITILIVLFLITTSHIFGGETKLIGFYAAPYVGTEPEIDGNLNEPEWEKAFTAKDYYQFAKMNPDKSELKTELKIIWTSKGIAVGITNYEKNPKKIKSKISLFDSGDLWTDDCAEIYFDPKGTSIGFFKFMINSLAVRSDMRRIDAAILLPDWSASGWRAATKILDDRWIIEAFFPWSDFDTQAKAGDLWRFEHARFAYSTGKFQGAVWAPEGMYARPQSFGYLYFYKDKEPSPSEVGKLLSGKVAPPWMFPYENKVINCTSINKFNCYSFDELKNKSSESIKKTLKEINNFSDKSKKLLDLKVEINQLLSIKQMNFAQLRQLQGYESDLNKTLWQLKLNTFISDLK
jgi:hypothetical protein